MKTRKVLRLKALAFGFSALVPVCFAQSAKAADAPKLDGNVLLQADEAVYNTDQSTVTAKGHVEIDYEGRILLADSVTYDQKTDVVTADGHVSLLDENGNVAFANHVTLTDHMRDGVLSGFGALLGKHGRMVAATAKRTEERYTTAYHVAYTPCKICNKPGQRTPVWQIKAYRVVHDEEKHKITFKDATLALFGVPFFYTPYLTEPDPTVHYASGLLTPDAGSSSSMGYFLRLPYYFAISPSEDATLEPIFTTGGGNVLLGEYRQRWNDGGMWLQASVAENPNGGYGGERSQIYSHIFGSGRWDLAPAWQVGFDAQVTSNDTYLKRYNIYQFDRLVNDIFVAGERGRSRFAITGYFFQGLRATDNNRTFPVALPLIEYTYIPLRKWLGGQFRVDVNSVALSRDIGTNDQRFTAETRWRLPIVASDGELWTFQLDARGDVYHTDTPAPLPSSSHFITRGLPYAALDWRWPFIAYGRNNRSVILEPIAQIIAAPYGGNPVGIPNEDSLNLEIDENNIFSFDQLPGYDLAQSGPRANFGLRAETRFGQSYVEGLVGQTFRLKSDPVFATDTGLTGTASDIVGRFSIKFPPYLNLTNRVDIDESTGTVRRNEVYLTGVYGRSSTQISYIQLSPTLGLPAREEVNAQADVNFYHNWQAFAAIRRDLIAQQTLDNEFGLGYEDECLAFSIAYRRKYTTDRDLPPSTSIILRLNLKTTDEPIRPFSLFPQ
ncbi:MAG: LPS assembly protein LptD, partial [Alphaproteobacteria bacterium]|nr:LPS assembly protein LptD [Alphaproteobacteria bacterium]